MSKSQTQSVPLLSLQSHISNTPADADSETSLNGIASSPAPSTNDQSSDPRNEYNDDGETLAVDSEHNRFCWRCFLAYYVAIITDWPWEVAAYLSGCNCNVMEADQNEVTRNQVDQAASGIGGPRYLSRLQFFYIWVRFVILFPIGLVAWAAICFRRDRLDKIFLKTEEKNGTQIYVGCHEPSQLMSNIVVPGVIVIVLVLWVSWRTAFCCELTFFRALKDCDLFKLVDEGNLKKLVEKIKNRRPDKCMKVFFLLIPVAYVIYSLLVSIVNLLAFQVVAPHDNNVLMDWGETKISGSSLFALIGLSICCFIAFDFLYIELILRYAYQCGMIISFVEIIKRKVPVDNESDTEIESGLEDMNNENYTTQKEALKDIKKLQKFLKQLNSSTAAVGLVVLISAFHATNCIISLLSDDSSSTYFQITALAARASQWAFLTLFTIFQTAQTNAALQQLRKTRLPMYAQPLEFQADIDNVTVREMMIKHASSITLKAKLFGITIYPWFPYLIIFLILFTLMVGPLGLRLFQHLL